MIASLEQSQISAEREYEEAHEILLESEKIHQEIKKEWQLFQQKREDLFKKAEEKAEKAITKAREEAEEIVEYLKNAKSNVNLKEHEWIEAKKMLQEAKPNLSKKNKDKTNNTEVSTQPLQPGDEIKLLTVNQTGEVLKQVGETEYLVQVGIMKVKVHREDLQLMKKEKKTYIEPVATIKGSNYHVKTELDLRGERFDDAMIKLEKYVDDSILAGYPHVSIIHGKGTGALRQGVQEFAKKHPSIASSRLGSNNEGGSGVTILEFR